MRRTQHRWQCSNAAAAIKRCRCLIILSIPIHLLNSVEQAVEQQLVTCSALSNHPSSYLAFSSAQLSANSLFPLFFHVSFPLFLNFYHFCSFHSHQLTFLLYFVLSYAYSMLGVSALSPSVALLLFIYRRFFVYSNHCTSPFHIAHLCLCNSIDHFQFRFFFSIGYPLDLDLLTHILELERWTLATHFLRS